VSISRSGFLPKIFENLARFFAQIAIYLMGGAAIASPSPLPITTIQLQNSHERSRYQLDSSAAGTPTRSNYRAYNDFLSIDPEPTHRRLAPNLILCKKLKKMNTC
jgi:hypothetical protein